MNETDRKLLVPAASGQYHIGDYSVIVRRRRDSTVFLRNEQLRFIADQRGWSRTAFAREVGIDNSYTAPRIWATEATKVTVPVAERIRAKLDVPMEEIAYLTPEGQSYDPRG